MIRTQVPLHVVERVGHGVHRVNHELHLPFLLVLGVDPDALLAWGKEEKKKERGMTNIQINLEPLDITFSQHASSSPARFCCFSSPPFTICFEFRFWRNNTLRDDVAQKIRKHILSRSGKISGWTVRKCVCGKQSTFGLNYCGVLQSNRLLRMYVICPICKVMKITVNFSNMLCYSGFLLFYILLPVYCSFTGCSKGFCLMLLRHRLNT